MAGEEFYSQIPSRPGERRDPNAWGGYKRSVGPSADDRNGDGKTGDMVYMPGTSGQEVDVARYRAMGEAAASRMAPAVDYTNAYADRRRAEAARAQQQDSIALARAAAMGQAPSRAELMGRSMIDQSLQAQLAGAASARGGAMGQAAAARQAANSSAAFRAQGTQQLAALRADEMARARDAWAGQVGAMRNQDYGAATQAAGMAGTEAQVDLANRQLNQQAQQYYEGKAFDVNTAALNAGLQSTAMDEGSRQFNVGMDFKKDEQLYDLAGGLAGGGATFMTGMMRAEGGPVEGGNPYIVGERGPELVVPQRDGVVIPAEQTPQVMALYEPPGQQLHQTADGHAFLQSEGDVDDGRPSLAGKSHLKARAPVSLGEAAATRPAPAPAPKAAPRLMTNDEIMRAAEAMQAQLMSEHQSRMAAGPAVSPMAQAAMMRGPR